ncbi:hypothetical protein [Microbulbifer sp. HZ11]|uniref:hypothetical protein n=1 Tax=Microbulbifer sp. HZ11 TaxID=1453501 RepID=UPI0005BBDF8D|nr:hypothetical protein [Microbulbifer sp. HZ11]
MYIEFSPTRMVTGGAGKLEAVLKKFDGGAPVVEGKTHQALSGFTEDTVYRVETEHQCETAPMTLTDSELSEWHEFASSCGAGEFFTFDPFGTEAAPSAPATVQLKRKSFKQQRRPGSRFVFSFTIVKIVA